MLKVGYLIEFAQGGFLYAFSSHLQPIRDQLRWPDKLIIDLESVIVHLDPATVNTDQAEVMDRWILSITNPERLAVTLDNRTVLLPTDSEPRDFYSELSLRSEPLHFDFRALSPWSQNPAYLIDRTRFTDD